MAGNMLHRKLFRDMRREAMQFVALILLCVLGIFLFSGIDSFYLRTRDTNNAYFAQNNLADFWISLPSADRSAIARLRAIDGIEDAASRFSLDMETDFPGDVTLNVTGYDGPMTINAPVVLDGEGLAENDLRGCLVQEGFAKARGLKLGDMITVRYGEMEYSLIIRGVVNSPEYISVTGSISMSADMSKYGYILANAAAFKEIPLSQFVVTIDDGADAAAVRNAIERVLPGAFIVDHDAHKSTAAVRGNETMFFRLSIVFPLAAYAIAALIVMTTLTRMIDKQRLQIGTLRALGYSAAQIRNHYLSYAIVPSAIGSVIGVFSGHYGIPAIAWDMIVGQNEYPFLVYPSISVQSWLMAAANVAVSTAICYHAYRKTQKETTASLLRPKPPKDGRRMFLERITPLWKRMDFNAKMVARNLMRSKLRTLMSCVGLLCCNVLLVASMGLQDSVNNTISGHYTRTLNYTVLAQLDASAGEAEAYRARLKADAVECAMDTSVRLRANGVERTTQLSILEDGQTLLRMGEGWAHAELPAHGAAVTEKIAEQFGLDVGDSISCQLAGDDTTFSLRVEKILTNYLTQGVFLSRSAWEGLRKGAFVPTAIYLRNPAQAALDRLDAMDEVLSVETTEKQEADALEYLTAVSTIFMLLTVIALALAFVICYNMGLINFAERTREYATLKVLGYHQKEIRKLILRENAIITAVAIALSIAPSYGLTGMILTLAESDSMCYAVTISAKSIAIGCLVTWCFSEFIQRLLARKVRGIDMVEALKSVE